MATKKKTSKKKVNKKKKAVSDEVIDPHWIRPEDFNINEFPTLTEESFIYVNGSGKPANGRPSKKIRLLTVMNLARIGCTESEMAATIGIFKDTMTVAKKNNPILPLLIAAGREEGCMSLRRKQYTMAMAGSERMLLWLGTNRLNQSPKPEPTAEEENPTPLQITFAVKEAVEPVQVTNAKSST